MSMRNALIVVAAVALVAMVAWAGPGEPKCGEKPWRAAAYGYRWECRQVWQWGQERDPKIKLGCDTAKDPKGCREAEARELELLGGGIPK